MRRVISKIVLIYMYNQAFYLDVFMSNDMDCFIGIHGAFTPEIKTIKFAIKIHVNALL